METNQTLSASATSMPTPTPNKIVDESAPEANLQGAFEPLVQEIKLLRESFSEKYVTLSDKYTQLEVAITTRKDEVSSKIGKIQEAIDKQKDDIANSVSSKIENTND